MNAAPVLWMPADNGTSEAIPSHGLARVTGVTNGVLQLAKPNADGDRYVVVVSDILVPPDKSGEVTYDPCVIAAYDPADGTPAVGEQWGAASGSWRLRKNKAGFRVVGGAGNGLVNVVRESGGGSLTYDYREGTPLAGVSIGTDTTWTDCTDFQIDLPSAGTYLLWAVVSGTFKCSALGAAPAAGIAHARLYDDTDTVEVPGSNVALVSVTVTGRQYSTSVGIVTGYVATGANTIKLQGYRFGGVTWTTCDINGSGGFGDIGLGYLKLA